MCEPYGHSGETTGHRRQLARPCGRQGTTPHASRGHRVPRQSRRRGCEGPNQMAEAGKNIGDIHRKPEHHIRDGGWLPSPYGAHQGPHWYPSGRVRVFRHPLGPPPLSSYRSSTPRRTLQSKQQVQCGEGSAPPRPCLHTGGVHTRHRPRKHARPCKHTPRVCENTHRHETRCRRAFTHPGCGDTPPAVKTRRGV
jgi:hypothetical protein